MKAGTHSASLKESHTTAYTPKQGPSLPRPQCGFALPAKSLQSTTFATLDSAVLLYTYISRFSVAPHYQQQLYLRPSFIAFFNFSHKRPTFAFTPESGFTLAFQRKIAHKGTHAETGVFWMGVVSLLSERSARSPTSPGRVSERQVLPLWDLGREVLSKNAESLRDSDALMRVAVPRRRGPAGLRDLFAIW